MTDFGDKWPRWAWLAAYLAAVSAVAGAVSAFTDLRSSWGTLGVVSVAAGVGAAGALVAPAGTLPSWVARHRRISVSAALVVALVAATAATVSPGARSPPTADANSAGLVIEIEGALNEVYQQPSLVVSPGDTVKVAIRLANRSPDVLQDITVRADTSSSVTFLPGSLRRTDANHQSSERLPDTSLSSGGANLGNYAPVASGEVNTRVDFVAQLPEEIPCNEMIIAHAVAQGVGDVSAVLALLVDRDGDGVADGARCEATAPEGGDWGPGRALFDWNVAADRVGAIDGPVFNSFIHTTSYGDERNFVTASRGNYDTPPEVLAYHDPLTGIADVGSVLVRIYIDNGANDGLNFGDEKGFARNTRVRLFFDPGVANGMGIAGYVSADNLIPPRVYDSVNIFDNQTSFSLALRPGSARLYSGAFGADGTPLSDDITTTGVLIGYDSLDGDLPAGFAYAAVVTAVFDITPS